jgi:EAL domain-containing protein (putative c-di-GMP-specific phosphodiesterase class I)
LKIAQELIFKVDSDFRKAAVVRAAIRLADELGIECLAEGVETETQASFLAAAGCEFAQGYYFSCPIDAKSTTELLRRGRINPNSSFVLDATAA